MVCFHRNRQFSHPYGRINQFGYMPEKPADWTEDEFLHEYNVRCIKEFHVKADKVICD